MRNYIAIVHKEAKSDFGVSFPDFPGCITAGKDIDEAKDMAQDALFLVHAAQNVLDTTSPDHSA